MKILKIMTWVVCWLLIGVVSPDPEGVNTTHVGSRPRDTSFYGNLNCPSSYASNVNSCKCCMYMYMT